jgi:hypothetical protein
MFVIDSRNSILVSFPLILVECEKKFPQIARILTFGDGLPLKALCPYFRFSLSDALRVKATKAREGRMRFRIPITTVGTVTA